MMKRKDSYFGLHFDFHANEETRDIGAEFDGAVLERILREVKPDFIQCDTKGHPGYSSYPTKVGTPAPGLRRDILRKWREITGKHGVLLFAHYSGLWDKKAMAEHPEWAAVTADGAITDKASVFGEYADKLLIPQLKELAGDYGMDGAWVDGECWAQVVDYGVRAREKWEKEGGREVPTEKDAEFPAFLEFQRRAFFAYVAHYISEVKKAFPEFEMTSNWLNTSWVPDDLAVTDWISGDLSPTDSVDSARFDGRLMQAFGRSWDMMSWGISFPVHYVKSAVQLCQEAAVVLSLGGGFQIYNMQSPQRTVMDEWAIPIWAEVAGFCRERQAYCQGGKVVPDVGVLYSAKANYSKMRRLYYRESEYNLEFCGLTAALCDCGYSVSVLLAERAAKGEIDLGAYKTIVVSNLSVLEAGIKEKLLAYTECGGNLVLCGKDTAELFAGELSLCLKPPTAQPVVIISGKDYNLELRAPYAKIGRRGGDAVFMRECVVEGDLACTNPPPAIRALEGQTAAFVSFPRGRGEVFAMPVNIGRLYFSENTFEIRRFAKECFSRREFGRIRLTGGKDADIVLTEKDGKDYIHVVNLQGEHRSGRVKTFDYIPPVCGTEIVYASGRKPKRIIARPEGKEIGFSYTQGRIHIAPEKVELYAIFEIEYTGEKE